MKSDFVRDVAKELGVSPHVLEADIKELAWCWEWATEDLVCPTPNILESILSSLVKAYLRGRNIRMGNYQGICRHLCKKRFIMVLVISTVAEDKYVFESLHKAGVTSVETFREMMVDSRLSLAEVESILKER